MGVGDLFGLGGANTAGPNVGSFHATFGLDVEPALKAKNHIVKELGGLATQMIGAFAAAGTIKAAEGAYMAFERESDAVGKVNRAMQRLNTTAAQMSESQRIIHDQSLRFGRSEEQTADALRNVIVRSQNATMAIKNYGLVEDVAATTGMDLMSSSNLVAKAITGQFLTIGRALPFTRNWIKEHKDLAGSAEGAAGFVEFLTKALTGEKEALANTPLGEMRRFREATHRMQLEMGRIFTGSSDTAQSWKDAADSAESFLGTLQRIQGLPIVQTLIGTTQLMVGDPEAWNRLQNDLGFGYRIGKGFGEMENPDADWAHARDLSWITRGGAGWGGGLPGMAGGSPAGGPIGPWRPPAVNIDYLTGSDAFGNPLGSPTQPYGSSDFAGPPITPKEIARLQRAAEKLRKEQEKAYKAEQLKLSKGMAEWRRKYSWDPARMMSSLNSEATKDAKAWNNTFFDVATESGSFELSKGAEKWATTVARHMNTEMQRSTNKYGRFLEQFFPPQGDLRKWAQKSGQTMHDTLSDALFATITDDWKSWQDGLHSLWLVFCRTITNDLSSSLMKATGLKQGSNVISQIGSWIGSLLGHTSGGGTPYEPVMETATGGVFYRPTMRLIGEGGPEAVVPLSQYNNGRGGGGGVTIHVHTPDATSFIRSKTQIMSEYAAAARTAARRRGYANG